jgi:hypothetical protein
MYEMPNMQFDANGTEQKRYPQHSLFAPSAVGFDAMLLLPTSLFDSASRRVVWVSLIAAAFLPVKVPSILTGIWFDHVRSLR